jgi:hypothetical protein
MKQKVFDHNQYTITNTLKSLYPNIRQEFMSWAWMFDQPEYRGTRDGPGQVKTGTWNVLTMMHRNKKSWLKRPFFPATFEIFKQIPVYENMRFSILGPQTELVPHTGWGEHFALVHLGIDCHGSCSLIVDKKEYPENNGEVIIFSDWYEHWAYNRADQTRVVLIFDILKTDLEKLRI